MNWHREEEGQSEPDRYMQRGRAGEQERKGEAPEKEREREREQRPKLPTLSQRSAFNAMPAPPSEASWFECAASHAASWVDAGADSSALQ